MTEQKKYGGMTLGEIRTECMKHPNQNDPSVQMLLALVTEVETIEPEILPRLRRIETKIHKLSLYSGAEPGTTMTAYAEEIDGRTQIRVSGYDVTLAQLRRAIEEKGLDQTRISYILKDRDSALLGTLHLTNRN